jgi:aminopeptidase N
MLRMNLRYRSGSDELFTKVLREFVREYSGKEASTEDFARVVERVAPGDWRWFFDAWIYGAQLPTYRWSYRVEPDARGFRVSLTVKRSDVDDAFALAVPMRFDFDGGRQALSLVMVRQPEQTWTEVVAMKPREVFFAPDHSVLGHFRRE